MDKALGRGPIDVAACDGAAHAEIVRIVLCGGLKNVDGELRVAGLHLIGGAAEAPVDPDGLHLPALIGGEVAARIEVAQCGIEVVVVAGVEEQPGVLDVNAGRCRSAAQQVVVLYLVEVFDRVGNIAAGHIEAGLGLDEVHIALKLLSEVGRNLGNVLKGLGVYDWRPGARR